MLFGDDYPEQIGYEPKLPDVFGNVEKTASKVADSVADSLGTIVPSEMPSFIKYTGKMVKPVTSWLDRMDVYCVKNVNPRIGKFFKQLEKKCKPYLREIANWYIPI
jgi:hypothetical protein